MFDWFRSLSGLEIAYFIIACIGTVALLIQIVMMLIGAGGEADADFDTDTDGDGSLDTHTDTGVSLFTGALTGLVSACLFRALAHTDLMKG